MEASTDSMAMQELYAPIGAYQNQFKQLHQKNTEEFFNQLVEKSEIDVEENRATNKKIAENKEQAAGNTKSIKWKKFYRILAVLLLLVSGWEFGKYIMIAVNHSYFHIIGFLSSIPFLVLSIWLIRKVNDKIKALKNIDAELKEVSDALHEEAKEQMQPLNNLLHENYNTQLFSKTIPLVDFDKVFSAKRLGYMVDKFGLNTDSHQTDGEQSTLYVQSGEIKGNPFFIRKNVQHDMGMKTYEGELTIHWTTRERDSDGKYRTVNHSQTLVAYVEKSCPYYTTNSHLVYGNEAGDQLSFSHTPSHIHELKERKERSLIKKRSKELQKLTEKATKEGGTFTALGNDEFDALYYAKDRNNESQFRLLFTPLAQQQTLKLLRDKVVGYGDSFTFVKNKKINSVFPEHFQDTKLEVGQYYFTGIDFDKMKETFETYHSEYFKQVYFAFAPIFAIPLYTQHQTQEYIYKDLYDSNVSFYEHEMAVNATSLRQVQHPDSDTRDIIKTSLLERKGDADTISVYAWGYRKVRRTDYITKWGRDNLPHKVPVHWDEYIRVEKESKVEVTVEHDTSNGTQHLNKIVSRILN